jgi:hypothetical protein
LPAWIGWLAWRGMDPATRPRFVTTVHGLYSVSRYSAIMTRGERVIAVSETVRDYLRRGYPGLPAERIQVIPRGVDPVEFPAWLSAGPRVAGGVASAISATARRPGVDLAGPAESAQGP